MLPEKITSTLVAAAVVAVGIVGQASAWTRPTHPPVKPIFNPPSHVLNPVLIAPPTPVRPIVGHGSSAPLQTRS